MQSTTSAAGDAIPTPLTPQYDAAVFVNELWNFCGKTRMCYARNKKLSALFDFSVDTVTRRCQVAESCAWVRLEYIPGRGRVIHLLKRPALLPVHCGEDAEPARTPCGEVHSIGSLTQDLCTKRQTDTQSATAIPCPPAEPEPVVVVVSRETENERTNETTDGARAQEPETAETPDNERKTDQPLIAIEPIKETLNGAAVPVVPVIASFVSEAKRLGIDGSLAARCALQDLAAALSALAVVEATKERRNPSGLFRRAFEGRWNAAILPAETPLPRSAASKPVRAEETPGDPAETLRAAARAGSLSPIAAKFARLRSDGGAAILGVTG